MKASASCAAKAVIDPQTLSHLAQGMPGDRIVYAAHGVFLSTSDRTAAMARALCHDGVLRLHQQRTADGDRHFFAIVNPRPAPPELPATSIIADRGAAGIYEMIKQAARYSRRMPLDADFAEQTGMPIPKIRDSIKKLSAAGLIRIETWFGAACGTWRVAILQNGLRTRAAPMGSKFIKGSGAV